MGLNYYKLNRFIQSSIEYEKCRCIFFCLADPAEIFFFSFNFFAAYKNSIVYKTNSATKHTKISSEN